MSESIKVVKDYYDNNAAKEWERLQTHNFEFEITSRFMKRYIKPGDKVLDIGGGPGRYSLFLANHGCNVTLFDLSDGNVAIAKEKAEELNVKIGTVVGDARDVDNMVHETFDHILLMGPMYHLLLEEDRIKAVNASLKLLKPGGLIFISFIAMFSGIIYFMKYCPEGLLDDSEALKDCLDALLAKNSYSGDGFTKAHFSEQSHILPFMEQFPLEKLHFFGQEGILAPCELNIMNQPEEVKNAWIDLAVNLCERDELIGYSEHIMYVGRKK